MKELFVFSAMGLNAGIFDLKLSCAEEIKQPKGQEAITQVNVDSNNTNQTSTIQTRDNGDQWS